MRNQSAASTITPRTQKKPRVRDRTAVLRGVAAVLLEELDDVRLAVRHLLLDLVLHLRMRVNAC